MNPIQAINLSDALSTFNSLWQPHVVTQFNGHDVMVVKVKGEFVWHSHEDTDDFFLVLKGRIHIDLPDRRIDLGPGEMFVVPRGMKHRPRAEDEAHLLLIEPAGTPNTGSNQTAAPRQTVELGARENKPSSDNQTASEINEIRAQVKKLTDREAIRDVLQNYCRAVDRGDIDLMKSCYHVDGTDDHGFFVGRGWDFADYVLPLLAQLEVSIHSLTNPIVEVHGDQAYAETQWSVIHRLKRFGKMTDMWHQGRYLDVFERREGEWKILKRVAVHDAERWINTADLQRLIPDTNPHKVFQGRRGKSDPVYQLTNLESLARENFRLPRLWEPLRQALLIPTVMVHWLGSFIHRRSRAS